MGCSNGFKMGVFLAVALWRAIVTSMAMTMVCLTPISWGYNPYNYGDIFIYPLVVRTSLQVGPDIWVDFHGVDNQPEWTKWIFLMEFLESRSLCR